MSTDNLRRSLGCGKWIALLAPVTCACSGDAPRGEAQTPIVSQAQEHPPAVERVSARTILPQSGISTRSVPLSPAVFEHVLGTAKFQDILSRLQSSPERSPFQTQLLGLVSEARRVLAHVSNDGVAQDSQSELRDLAEELMKNPAVERLVELGKSAPMTCGALRAKIQSLASATQDPSGALAAAERTLASCGADTDFVPGAWAGLLDENMLLDVTLADEILLRGWFTDLVGGLAVAGGVALIVVGVVTGNPTLVAIGIVVGIAGLSALGVLDSEGAVRCDINGNCDVGDIGEVLTAGTNGCLQNVPTCQSAADCPAGTLCGFGCCEIDQSAPITTTNNRILYPVTLPVPKAVEARDIALWASTSLRIDDRARVINEAGGGARVVQAAQGLQVPYATRVGVDARVGNVDAASALLLSDRAAVQGTIRTLRPVLYQNQSTTTVTGGILVGEAARAQMFAPNFFGWIVSFDLANRPDVTLAPGGSATLPPGNYRNLAVKAGGVLTLSPGNYFFESMSVEPQAVLRLQGNNTAVVHVRQQGFFRGLVQQASPGVQTLAIVYLGTQSLAIGSTFQGTIVAPRAEINCDVGAAEIRASLWARSVVLHQGATVRLMNQNPWIFLSSFLPQIE